MHEALLSLSLALVPHLPLAAGGDTSGNVKVAIITGAFLLAGTIFTTLAPKRGDAGASKTLANAQRNLDSANKRADRAERRNETLSADNDRMRDLLNLYDKDPNEDPDVVRRRLQHDA